MRKAVPWALVGFVAGAAVGAALGLSWGQKAKSRLGEAVSTNVDGGKVSVTVDLAHAAAVGLPDLVQRYL